MTSPKLVISEFSTLNFRDNWRLAGQYPARYVQRLLRTDSIDTQYALFGDFQGNLSVIMTDATGDTIATGTLTALGALGDGTAYRVDWPETLFPLASGSYAVVFRLLPYDMQLARAEFCVENELPDTVLFDVTNDEDDFNTIFNGQHFRFRVEAAWMPADVTFQAESQHFRDQNGALHQLHSSPYETRTLTIGGCGDTIGVPNWVGRKVNKLLACSTVTIDGTRYSRSEGANVERTDIADNWPMYLYKIALEPTDDACTLPLPQQCVQPEFSERLLCEESAPHEKLETRHMSMVPNPVIINPKGSAVTVAVEANAPWTIGATSYGWGDGSDDRLTLDFTGEAGSSYLVVSSDPYAAHDLSQPSSDEPPDRERQIDILTTDGRWFGRLTVRQRAGHNNAYCRAYSNAYNLADFASFVRIDTPDVALGASGEESVEVQVSSNTAWKIE